MLIMKSGKKETTEEIELQNNSRREGKLQVLGKIGKGQN